MAERVAVVINGDGVEHRGTRAQNDAGLDHRTPYHTRCGIPQRLPFKPESERTVIAFLVKRKTEIKMRFFEDQAHIKQSLWRSVGADTNQLAKSVLNTQRINSIFNFYAASNYFSRYNTLGREKYFR